MKLRGESMGRGTAVLLLVLVAPCWGACSSSSATTKSGEPAAAAAPAETAPSGTAAEPAAPQRSEPASTRPLPGTLPYSADRIRDIESGLKPLKAIPTKAESASQAQADEEGKVASPKLTHTDPGSESR